MLERLNAFFSRLRETLLLMVGIPSYERYVAHLREHHPEKPVPDYAAFLRERQNARYGAGMNGRCC